MRRFTTDARMTCACADHRRTTFRQVGIIPVLFRRVKSHYPNQMFLFSDFFGDRIEQFARKNTGKVVDLFG